MSGEEPLTQLTEAAQRAGYIVTEQIEAIIERAEREAEAIRRDAERDAEDTRREAVEAAQRLLGRLQALEFPLGNLVANLRDEMDMVSKQLGEGGQAVDTHATALPADAGPTTADDTRLVEVADPQSERAVIDGGQATADDDRPDAGTDAEVPAEPQGESWKRWVKEDDDVIAANE